MNEILIRRYAASVVEGDGRTIVGRCVPYDEVAHVVDGPTLTPYREVYRHGAFSRASRDPARVLLNYEHREGIGDVVGTAVELVERDDGLHGIFRALGGVPGDQALELIRANACVGLSVGVIPHPRGTRVLDDGTVERSRVRLVHVALTSSPAYLGAGVVAVRHGGTRFPNAASVLDTTARLRAKYAR